ncbi:MAG: hypothetical protein A2W00_09345 [Candidatus Eisenbacteria bacterium RBG_16_71_46]|nr:MAG: hypothetical protein A2W00_09345 [Candidatus Eisenbacteria bacterium RBG_16_71_46]
MHTCRSSLIALVIALTTLASPGRAESPLARGVFEAESLFARTMADRDVKTFASFVAVDAVFFGGRGVLRGKAAIVEGWKPFFEGVEPPFSWKPEQVEVLDSGKLAHSSGPVLDPTGRRIATFNSVWRLERDGRWRVVFDKGCAVCDSLRAQ